MRRLRGRWRERNLETNDRTEERELRSRGRTMISDKGDSAKMRFFISSAVLRLRAGITSLAPRFARTLAVSAPIPDVAPVMIAVIWWRLKQQAAVTASAVDFEPKPLCPAEPIRYFTVSSIFFFYCPFYWFICKRRGESRRLCGGGNANSQGLKRGAARFYI